MDKRNSVVLSLVVVLRKFLMVFFEFFLNIYLFRLVNGDFGFLISYSSFGAVVGIIAMWLVLRVLNNRNAKVIFGVSLGLKIICILMLLILRNDILSVIWIFKALDRIGDTWYSCVYETSLIKNTKRGKVGGFVAEMSMLESVVAILTPVLFGYVIDVFSYEIAFLMMAVDAIIMIVVGAKLKIGFKDEKYRLIEFWKKAFRKKHMREAYKVMFFQRVALTGALGYLIPVILIMTLGTEFSVGGYKSLFSVVFIILMGIIRLIDRRKKQKDFYVLAAFLLFLSAVVMVANINEGTVLLYYFMSQTVGYMIVIEARATTYAMGKEEGLARYTRENIFTWNIYLVLGQLLGNGLALVAYNWFYGVEGLAVAITVLMAFVIVQAFYIQKAQKWLWRRR